MSQHLTRIGDVVAKQNFVIVLLFSNVVLMSALEATLVLKHATFVLA